MALVRCTCVTDLRVVRGRSTLSVVLADPMCDYVVHRVVGPSELSEGLDAPS